MDNRDDYDIRVRVRSEYLPAQSGEGRYAFAYHVRIENAGMRSARLLSRHWVITNGNQQVQEVRGDGVIGQQPQIAPGEVYEYSSGAVLETPVGAMHGSYRMVGDDGTAFDAAIPAFTLAVPRALN